MLVDSALRQLILVYFTDSVEAGTYKSVSDIAAGAFADFDVDDGEANAGRICEALVAEDVLEGDTDGNYRFKDHG